MAVELDFLTRIVNVHWESPGQHFLYSGADGMFGSANGETWEPAPVSVPAASLAWIDDVWIGCGPDGIWRSEDGAKTWEIVAAPAFIEVAAMKPEGVDSEGNPKQGVFAGWLEDEEGNNHIVYTSLDLGKTWGTALTIPTTVDDTGSESIMGLSGCGGAFFVCTNRHEQVFHAGDGMIYSSTDGLGFSSAMVFGPGTTILPEDPDQFPRKGFAANAVGYDPQSKTYIAIGDKEIIPGAGQDSFLIYTTSASPTFPPGDGTVAESASQSTGIGEFISVARSAAGGNGRHVTGFFLFRTGPGGAFISGDLKAHFIPGASDVLQAMGSSAGGYVGSFCFNGSSEENTEGSTDDAGIFACAAFGFDKAGGAYIAQSGGSFALRHAGTGFTIGGNTRGAVAVGNIDFLGQT